MEYKDEGTRKNVSNSFILERNVKEKREKILSNGSIPVDIAERKGKTKEGKLLAMPLLQQPKSEKQNPHTLYLWPRSKCWIRASRASIQHAATKVTNIEYEGSVFRQLCLWLNLFRNPNIISYHLNLLTDFLQFIDRFIILRAEEIFMSLGNIRFCGNREAVINAIISFIL